MLLFLSFLKKWLYVEIKPNNPLVNIEIVYCVWQVVSFVNESFKTKTKVDLSENIFSTFRLSSFFFSWQPHPALFRPLGNDCLLLPFVSWRAQRGNAWTCGMWMVFLYSCIYPAWKTRTGTRTREGANFRVRDALLVAEKCLDWRRNVLIYLSMHLCVYYLCYTKV